MADNVPITSGAGLTVASDEDGGGLQHQWIKIKFGGDGSFTAVSTANGFPVQVLSLPDLGLNSSIKITSLPDLGLNSAVKITSLPPLGAAIVSVNNFTFVLSITNLASAPLTVSGTTIAITSLPDLGLNSVVKITSLPDLGLGSAVKITSLPSLAFGQSVTITNGAILSITNLVPVLISDSAYRYTVNQAAPISGYFRFTSTYTSAQTNAVLVALPSSTTSLHITDCIFSNAQTHGSFTLLCSPTNGTLRTVLDRLYFRDYGGAVLNLQRPLVLDTNCALVFTSRSATDHSVTVIGYVR